MDIAHGSQGLDRRRDSRFHIGRPAACESIADDLRRDKREVNRVEVTVELQRPPWLSRRETGDHRRSLFVTRHGPFDSESVGTQYRLQFVGGGSRFAGPTRFRDQAHRRIQQTFAIDGFANRGRGIQDVIPELISSFH
jgi:hypothetical protein